MLLLLPNLLGDHKYHEPYLPASVGNAVETLDGLIAESDRAGRRFLSRFETKKPVREMPISILDKNTPDQDLDFLLEPIREGERWGYVADAGLPCVADPGAKLVRRARQTGVQIQAYVGPSSITLALMLSGLSGQNFSFHGYLAKDPSNREKEIHEMELVSKKEGITQIMIEVPYRNRHLLESLLRILSDQTVLCVAAELTMPEQMVLSQTVELWKKSPLPNLEKKNAIFLFGV